MIPFDQYLDLKDHYCLGYFGNDLGILTKVVEAKNIIEKELKGMIGWVACKDDYVLDVSDMVIPESKMADYKGKMAFFCNLEEKDDIKVLLERSKIPIPDDF